MKSEFDKQQREIESGERWLAAFEAPAVSDESRSRIKHAIRAELTARCGSARRWRVPAWVGAVSAAAVIVLCVTLIYNSPTTSVQIVERGDTDEGVSEAPPDLQDVMPAEIVFVVELDRELTELEGLSVGFGDLDVSAVYEAFQDALDGTDGVDAPEDSTSRLESRQQDSKAVTA